MEFIFFDIAAKKATPVPLPKEVTGETAEVGAVLPSPDGKRLLFAWAEEVPPPADWPHKNWPCRPARMTVADRDGKNSTTIYMPEVKETKDSVLAQWGWIDWR